MQPTTLLDNLNSDLLAALSTLLPKGSPKRVLVYVESDDDISFWRNILTPFEAKGVDFDIQLPIRDVLEKGKASVMYFFDKVGPNLILCVDSDYDYLLQYKTPISSKINGSDFIFQTYAYSIENLLCYSGSLHALCVQSAKNDLRIVDFDVLTKLYSRIIHKLFLWSVYFSSQQNTPFFTISNFSDTIKIFKKVEITEQFELALLGLKNKVDAKIQELETLFPSKKPNIETLSDVLKHLGVNEDNTYLFAHGHTIKEHVLLPFLKSIVNELFKQKMTQINQVENETVRADNRRYYKNQIIPIEVVLKTNTAFKSCFLYEKIETDLTKYIKYFE